MVLAKERGRFRLSGGEGGKVGGKGCVLLERLKGRVVNWKGSKSLGLRERGFGRDAAVGTLGPQWKIGPSHGVDNFG